MSPRDDKGPVWRKQDRDVRTEKHAAPVEFVSEEATGKYEGAELQRIRARRPTPERISKVEVRQDKVEVTLTEFRVETTERLSKLEGKIDTVVDLATRAEAERARRSELDALERERKRRMVVPTIKAVAAAIALIIAALVGKGAL